jgi:hypothetical protein
LIVGVAVLLDVDVGFAEVFAVGFVVALAVLFTVALAVAFTVGDGVGFFVAACAALPDIASANIRKSATFLNRAPT